MLNFVLREYCTTSTLHLFVSIYILCPKSKEEEEYMAYWEHIRLPKISRLEAEITLLTFFNVWHDPTLFKNISGFDTFPTVIHADGRV